MRAFRRREAALAAAVLLLGGIALLQGRLSALRPSPTDRSSGSQFSVTSPADTGPGTLREAIFAAARSEKRPRIVLAVREIRPMSPLPPLVHRAGTIIESAEGEIATIDASDLGTGAVLDIRSPFSTVARIAIRRASGPAIRVSVEGVGLVDLELEDSDTGVEILAGARGLLLEGSRFRGNRVGVRIESHDSASRILDNRFERHAQAGVWGTRPSLEAGTFAQPVTLANNHFAGDDTAIVLANLDADVFGNDIVGSRQTGIFVAGRGSRIRDNRVREGKLNGIVAAHTQGLVLARNEIDHQTIAGLVLNSCRSTTLEGNRIYQNLFGLLSIFGDPAEPNTVVDNLLLDHRADGVVVIGGSPVLRSNRVAASVGAALRIMDYIGRDGSRTNSEPLLQDLRHEGNGSDEPVRDVYSELEGQR